MRSTTALGRRARAGAVLAAMALGALFAVAGVGTAASVTAASTTAAHGDHGLPFSFD